VKLVTIEQSSRCPAWPRRLQSCAAWRSRIPPPADQR